MGNTELTLLLGKLAKSYDYSDEDAEALMMGHVLQTRSSVGS